MSFSTTDILSAIKADPSLFAQLQEMFQASDPQAGSPNVPAIPAGNPFAGRMFPLDRVTFLHASFWDNGPEIKYTDKGGKKKGARYKLTIEAWDQSADQIQRRPPLLNVTFKRNIALRSPKDFAKILYKNTKAGKISQAFNDDVMAYISSDQCAKDRDLLGLVSDTTNGWEYFDGQLIVVRFDHNDIPMVSFMADSEVLEITGFESNSDTSSKVKYQADLDRCGYLDLERDT